MSKIIFNMFNFSKITSKVEIKLFLISTFIFFYFYRAFPLRRIGDGAEYILQYQAITETRRPWINAVALESYSSLFQRGEISYLVSAEQIKNAFPSLATGTTFDLNHFWFYSALAGSIHIFAKFFLINLSVASSFIILHSLLFNLNLYFAWRYFKLKGVLSVFFLLLLSPLFWYGNKIHTEFFTFNLVCMATIFMYKNKIGYAALALAFCSTQNPSFAIISIILLLLFVSERRFKVFDLKNLGVIFSVFCFVSLHPLYYLWRQGVLTPQLKAGGASVGVNYENFFIWLIDPDIGLFPNWPVGFYLVVQTIMLVFVNKRKLAPFSNFIFYVLAFVTVSLFAQSSTTNLNSGGTPGVARYSLWYVGLFFPSILYFISLLYSKRKKINFIPTGILLCTLSVLTVSQYAPFRAEQYTNPTKLSRFIQTYAPTLYSPPIPVFVGRYSGIGEDLKISSVVGPDCLKMVIIVDPTRTDAISPANCLYSKSKLQNFVSQKRLKLSSDQYFTLDNKEAESIKLELMNYILQFNDKGLGGQFLGHGWSRPESWGVWTMDNTAELFFPCKVNLKDISEIKLRFNVFGNQEIAIKSENPTASTKSFHFSGANREIFIKVASNSCRQSRLKLTLEIPGAKSPQELGVSEDSRKLGIGLVMAEFS
jgi:hypothetical protein